MFRLMKLRPPHGWNAVVWELGIVTLGVLIALGAQQVVDDVHQRGEARDAEQAIRGELELNMAKLKARAEKKPCVVQRLAELQALIDSAGPDGGAIETPSWIGRPQFWTMQTARWEATAQAGRAALVSPKHLALYGSMYAYMRSVNTETAAEQDHWATLRSLEHLGRLTPEMQFQLTTTLQQARYINWRMGVWTKQLEVVFDRLHLRTVPNDIAASRSACIAMSTPRDQAVRQSNSYSGDEP